MKPPRTIDNAVVLEYAWSDAPFGVIKYSDSDNIAAEIHGFAICKYPNSNIYYRFSCNKNWETAGDTDHLSIEEAKKFLNESQYDTKKIHWEKPI